MSFRKPSIFLWIEIFKNVFLKEKPFLPQINSDRRNKEYGFRFKWHYRLEKQEGQNNEFRPQSNVSSDSPDDVILIK